MNKKYEFTDETIKIGDDTLYRIRALIDIPVIGVKVGDLGGFIEKEKNLSHEGYAWVSEDALVSEDAWVSENACVYGNARVSENACVYGNAQVYGNALVFGNAQVYGNACVYGNARVSENACVYGNARVS